MDHQINLIAAERVYTRKANCRGGRKVILRFDKRRGLLTVGGFMIDFLPRHNGKFSEFQARLDTSADDAIFSQITS